LPVSDNSIKSCSNQKNTIKPVATSLYACETLIDESFLNSHVDTENLIEWAYGKAILAKAGNVYILKGEKKDFVEILNADNVCWLKSHTRVQPHKKSYYFRAKPDKKSLTAQQTKLLYKAGPLDLCKIQFKKKVIFFETRSIFVVHFYGNQDQFPWCLPGTEDSQDKVSNLSFNLENQPLFDNTSNLTNSSSSFGIHTVKEASSNQDLQHKNDSQELDVQSKGQNVTEKSEYLKPFSVTTFQKDNVILKRIQKLDKKKVSRLKKWNPAMKINPMPGHLYVFRGDFQAFHAIATIEDNHEWTKIGKRDTPYQKQAFYSPKNALQESSFGFKNTFFLKNKGLYILQYLRGKRKDKTMNVNHSEPEEKRSDVMEPYLTNQKSLALKLIQSDVLERDRNTWNSWTPKMKLDAQSGHLYVFSGRQNELDQILNGDQYNWMPYGTQSLSTTTKFYFLAKPDAAKLKEDQHTLLSSNSTFKISFRKRILYMKTSSIYVVYYYGDSEQMAWETTTPNQKWAKGKSNKSDPVQESSSSEMRDSQSNYYVSDSNEGRSGKQANLTLKIKRKGEERSKIQSKVPHLSVSEKQKSLFKEVFLIKKCVVNLEIMKNLPLVSEKPLKTVTAKLQQEMQDANTEEIAECELVDSLTDYSAIDIEIKYPESCETFHEDVTGNLNESCEENFQLSETNEEENQGNHGEPQSCNSFRIDEIKEPCEKLKRTLETEMTPSEKIVGPERNLEDNLCDPLQSPVEDSFSDNMIDQQQGESSMHSSQDEDQVGEKLAHSVMEFSDLEIENYGPNLSVIQEVVICNGLEDDGEDSIETCAMESCGIQNNHEKEQPMDAPAAQRPTEVSNFEVENIDPETQEQDLSLIQEAVNCNGLEDDSEDSNETCAAESFSKTEFQNNHVREHPDEASNLEIENIDPEPKEQDLSMIQEVVNCNGLEDDSEDSIETSSKESCSTLDEKEQTCDPFQAQSSIEVANLEVENIDPEPKEQDLSLIQEIVNCNGLEDDSEESIETSSKESCSTHYEKDQARDPLPTQSSIEVSNLEVGNIEIESQEPNLSIIQEVVNCNWPENDSIETCATSQECQNQNLMTETCEPDEEHVKVNETLLENEKSFEAAELSLFQNSAELTEDGLSGQRNRQTGDDITDAYCKEDIILADQNQLETSKENEVSLTISDDTATHGPELSRTFSNSSPSNGPSTNEEMEGIVEHETLNLPLDSYEESPQDTEQVTTDSGTSTRISHSLLLPFAEDQPRLFNALAKEFENSKRKLQTWSPEAGIHPKSGNLYVFYGKESDFDSVSLADKQNWAISKSRENKHKKTIYFVEKPPDEEEDKDFRELAKKRVIFVKATSTFLVYYNCNPISSELPKSSETLNDSSTFESLPLACDNQLSKSTLDDSTTLESLPLDSETLLKPFAVNQERLLLNDIINMGEANRNDLQTWNIQMKLDVRSGYVYAFFGQLEDFPGVAASDGHAWNLSKVIDNSKKKTGYYLSIYKPDECVGPAKQKAKVKNSFRKRIIFLKESFMFVIFYYGLDDSKECQETSDHPKDISSDNEVTFKSSLLEATNGPVQLTNFLNPLAIEQAKLNSSLVEQLEKLESTELSKLQTWNPDLILEPRPGHLYVFAGTLDDFNHIACADNMKWTLSKSIENERKKVGYFHTRPVLEPGTSQKKRVMFLASSFVYIIFYNCDNENTSWGFIKSISDEHKAVPEKRKLSGKVTQSKRMKLEATAEEFSMTDSKPDGMALVSVKKHSKKKVKKVTKRKKKYKKVKRLKL